MTLKFKRVPIGKEFFLKLGMIEYLGRKTKPFKVLSKDRNKFFSINALLIPREKEIHGSDGIVATISRKTRVLLAA